MYFETFDFEIIYGIRPKLLKGVKGVSIFEVWLWKVVFPRDMSTRLFMNGVDMVLNCAVHMVKSGMIILLKFERL